MSENRSVENLLSRIQVKCAQYWNTKGLPDEEVHAILEWIHREAGEAKAAVTEARQSLTGSAILLTRVVEAQRALRGERG